MIPSSETTGNPSACGTARPHLQRVYLDFYRLREPPFAITPDPEFLYLAQTHLNAIDKILYGIESRMGFILLTGEVGTGKTTICRALLDRLQDRAVTVYLINPSFSGRELIAAILEDLGLPCPAEASKKDLVGALNRFLLASEPRQPVVILIDDAQSIPVATMEDLRLLSNLETDKQKLLQLVLAGQPELENRIFQPALRQLGQRVTIHCRLDRLAPNEIQAYIARRLFVAGDQGQVRFTRQALRKIQRITGGIPRMINKVCDLALTAAYTHGEHRVTAAHLRAAATELVAPTAPGAGRCWRRQLCRVGVCGLVMLLLAGFLGVPALDGTAPKAPAPPAHAAASPEALRETAPAAAKHAQDPGNAAPPGGPTAVAGGRGAFVLQLGSSQSLRRTLKAVREYQQAGIPAHWNHVDMGQRGRWYRIFTGRFDSREAAERFKRTHALNDAMALKAPLTVMLREADRPEDLAPAAAILRQNRYDGFVTPAGANRYRLASGAYVSPRRAALAAAELTRLGFTPRVFRFELADGNGNFQPQKTKPLLGE